MYSCVSAADTVAVNFNGIKALLANGWSIFCINGEPIFRNEPRSLPKNLSDCIVLDNSVLDSLTSTDELSEKALQRFVTCLSVNNSLYRKLVSPSKLPFEITSLSFFIVDFNL